MGILFGFYALVASLFAPLVSITVVVAGSVLFVGVQYVVGKKLALRSVGAEPLSREERPEIHGRVEELSAAMGIEKPALKVGRLGVPNAFAVGRRGTGTSSSRRRCSRWWTRGTCRWTSWRASWPTSSPT